MAPRKMRMFLFQQQRSGFFLVFCHGDSKNFMRISPVNHRPHIQEPPRRRISAGRAPLGVSRVCRPRVLLYHPPGAVAWRKPLALWIQDGSTSRMNTGSTSSPTKEIPPVVVFPRGRNGTGHPAGGTIGHPLYQRNSIKQLLSIKHKKL